MYTELMVLKSAAGWYVGTCYVDSDGIWYPGSRDSGYFNSEVEAEECLSILLADCE